MSNENPNVKMEQTEMPNSWNYRMKAKNGDSVSWTIEDRGLTSVGVSTAERVIFFPEDDKLEKQLTTTYYELKELKKKAKELETLKEAFRIFRGGEK